MTEIIKLYLDKRRRNFYMFFNRAEALERVAEIESRGFIAEIKDLPDNKIIVFELENQFDKGLKI